MDVALRQEPIDGPAGREMLGAFVDEIAALYPGWGPGVGPTAEPHEVTPPHGCFLVAFDGGVPVGCVAVKKLDERTGEIKRLYVTPKARRAGVARRLLDAIEDAARELGCERVRLDTGDKQPASLSLFRATGYVEIDDYNGNPYAAYWMEKRLDSRSMLVIDTANVIGSRPNGWWRDRAGATRRLTERVRATVTAGALEPPVTLVLEGRARAGADEAEVDGVEVVHAPGEGDDTIAAIAEAHRGAMVVTADRALADRVRAADAEVVGPSWLLDRLVD